MRRPPVNTASWFNLYQDERVSVYVDKNDSIFYKVVVDKKTKYFYNETAHHDVPRFLVDTTKDGQYWSVLYHG